MARKEESRYGGSHIKKNNKKNTIIMQTFLTRSSVHSLHWVFVQVVKNILSKQNQPLQYISSLRDLCAQVMALLWTFHYSLPISLVFRYWKRRCLDRPTELRNSGLRKSCMQQYYRQDIIFRFIKASFGVIHKQTEFG